MKRPADLDRFDDDSPTWDLDQILGMIETGARKVRSARAMATTAADPAGRVLLALGLAAKLAHMIKLPEAAFAAMAAQAFRSQGPQER